MKDEITKTDSQAAEEYVSTYGRLDHLSLMNLWDQRIKDFLAGIAHQKQKQEEQLQAQKREVEQLHQRIKDLESEREQIARDAFEASRQEYVFKEGTILELRDKQFPTFQHYWQQKQKEQDDKR